MSTINTQVINTRDLNLVFERTGSLASAGIPEQVQASKAQRTIIFSTDTGDVVKNAGQNTIKFDILGSVLHYSFLESKDGSFSVFVLSTTANTYFGVVTGRKICVFWVPESSENLKEAVIGLLANNLGSKEERYAKTGSLAKDFWYQLLNAVFVESTVLEFSIPRRGRTPVPTRVYFSPKSTDTTISVGGNCYDYYIGVFPTEAIAKGFSAFDKEHSRLQAKEAPRVLLGNLAVGKSNKGKERNKKVDVAEVLGKSESEMLGYGQALSQSDLEKRLAMPVQEKVSKPKKAPAPQQKQPEKKKGKAA